MLPRATLVALGLLGYTYAGYPALIGALARLRPHRSERDQGYLPSVSVLMAAYNAESLIGAKLDILQGLDYPADKLEFLVYSDGSTERTDELVGQRAAVDPRIIAMRSDERRGKPSALNAMRLRAKGEVFLMCDVRQRFDPGALRALVRWLADPSVGCVSGNLVMEGEAGSGVYWRYEKWIREREARFRSVPGVTGAIYVVRGSDLEELPEDTILDDVLIPMRLRLRGKKVLFEPEARAFDTAAADDKEFGRKARTLAGANGSELIQELRAMMAAKPQREFMMEEDLIATVLSSEQVSEFRTVWLATLIYTGMLPGEAHGLKLEDLQVLGRVRTFRVQRQYKLSRAKIPRKFGSLKTKNSYRVLPLHPDLWRRLEPWIASGWSRYVGRGPNPEDVLFPDPEGNPFREDRADDFRDILTGLELPTTFRGIPLIPYAVRHTFSTVARRVGIPAEDRDYFMGHGSKSVRAGSYDVNDVRHRYVQIRKLPSFTAEGLREHELRMNALDDIDEAELAPTG